MFAESFLAVALSLAAVPPEGAGPPAISPEELNAFVEAGNYHRIRVEKLGQRFQATGTVSSISADGRWLIVEMSGHLSAALNGLPKGHGLAGGDRVRFDGLIVGEGYDCLEIWTYRFETLSPDGPAGEREAQSAPALSEPPATRVCGANVDAALGPHDAIRRNAAAAKSSEELLPKVTPADLDAALARGDYAMVRREMIGLRLDADAIVESVDAWPVVRLSENWQAHLHGHVLRELRPGDRIRVVGLICDEAYAAVSVWVERVEKQPK